MRLSAFIDEQQAYLTSRGIAQARDELLWLVAHGLTLEHSALLFKLERELLAHEEQLLRTLVARRASNEPYEYIVGGRSFLGVELTIDRRVLIPRQETELLADRIVSELSYIKREGKELWDLCTGSGALAIALKKRYPELIISASDLSSEALDCARVNSARNGVDVHFYQGDLWAPFEGKKCDFLVANPPYVSEKEFNNLPDSVRKFEPTLALVAREEGLEVYRRIAIRLSEFLRPEGKAWLEIGKDQGESASRLFREAGFSVIVEKDLAGHDRYLLIAKGLESKRPRNSPTNDTLLREDQMWIDNSPLMR